MSDTRNPSSVDSSLSRRQAIKAGAGLAAILATGVAPRVLRPRTRPDAKAKVYGKGAHTYEVIDNWAKRPEDKPWGDTHMVQEVADGRIFIHHNGPESVHVYDPDGKFIEAWGDEHAGAAHGMDLRKEGSEEFLYFAPTGQHRVVKTNLKGEKVFELGYPEGREERQGRAVLRRTPKQVRPDVHRLRPRRRRLLRRRRLRLQLRPPLQHQGRIPVAPSAARATATASSTARTASTATRATRPTRRSSSPTARTIRLQWFTLDGKYIKTVTDELRDPCHFDQQGTDILIPDLNGRVTIFDKDNKLVTHLGDNPDPAKRRNHGVPKEELTPGDFCTPHGAIWDRAGNIYVAEWLPYGRVTKLRRVSA